MTRTKHPGIESYPKRVAILAVDDTGPDSGARCPHCGAEGRYIYHFLCDDMVIRRAMAGCIHLFKEANRYDPMTRMLRAYFDKLEGMRGQTSSGGPKLASWFRDVEAALEQYQFDADLDKLRQAGVAAFNQREAWLRQKGYRR